ncbi:hypothetical protein [Paenibacillus oceani]|uniref:Radical SAM protein n=1 Tax=Paenibacillus oceani TaxID=2772510 RepID=A0A927CC63_9BACL|nr:hypothetical protein [Paenibacillus oceani]MBD2863291.1 hypothetical protein [Paenibacillus oceani]
MKYEFVYDERLGIGLPVLHDAWEALTEAERAELLHEWERVRGRIPDRIMQLEKTIVEKQNRLNTEDDFPTSCRLNTEIAELASCITDLHLWFRADQDVSVKGHY